MSALTQVRGFVWRKYSGQVARTQEEAEAFHGILSLLEPGTFSFRGTVRTIATRIGARIEAVDTITGRATEIGVLFPPTLWWDKDKKEWTRIWRSRIVYGSTRDNGMRGILILRSDGTVMV